MTAAPLQVTVTDGHKFTPVGGGELTLPITFELDGVTVFCTTIEEISDHLRTRAIQTGKFYGRSDFEAYLKVIFGVENTGPRVLGKWGERRTISFS